MTQTAGRRSTVPIGPRHRTAGDIHPRWRGWSHLSIVPVAVVAGVVLVVLAPTTPARLGCAAFALSGVLLFGASGAYHSVSWSPRTLLVMRRLDHCGILVLIAGSCTAYSLLLLEGTPRTSLMVIAWSGAAAGVVVRLTWPRAPRWVSPPIYIGLGWAALLFTPAFIDGAQGLGPAGVGSVVLLAAGGALYTTGAVVYLLQRPDPWPHSFGFHEVFHVFTIAAFACHFVGVSLASLSLR